MILEERKDRAIFETSYLQKSGKLLLHCDYGLLKTESDLIRYVFAIVASIVTESWSDSNKIFPGLPV